MNTSEIRLNEVGQSGNAPLYFFLYLPYTPFSRRFGVSCVLTLEKPQVKSANALYLKYRTLGLILNTFFGCPLTSPSQNRRENGV